MAERILSPGVFSRENDLSFITPAPAEISTAIVGPTPKGPIDIPVAVTSYGEYRTIFGETFKSGSDYYTHFTTLAAENFFQQGGDSLLVTRVSDQTFTSATASIYSASAEVFRLETLGEGEIMNNGGSVGTNESLYNGTADNLRWEITSVNADVGTFSLVIRRGDDNHKDKVILESYPKLSLDPKSEDYIARVIGDQVISNTAGVINATGDYPNRSRYVRVHSVSQKTPDYFDNDGVAKSAFSTLLGDISVGSGSANGTFGGAIGTLFDPDEAPGQFYENAPHSSGDSQGIDVSGTAYNNAITALSNKDEFRFNVLLTPGLTHEDNSAIVSSFTDMVEDRGDAIYVTDLVGYGSSIATATTQAGSLNSSYAAAYWPWVKVFSQGLGKNVWAPASTVMGGVYAFNDRVGAEWFAPAGLLRGGIPGVISAERKLSQSNRDDLYLGKVNPIATFPGSGVVAYGQKTLQTKASALDRVNVRRLLINLKNFIGEQANTLVFEQNTIATRNRFLAAVNPYLETVVQRQGLYAYRVVMDDTNNTSDVIDRNQLVGQVFIQPTKTAEFIVLDFVVQPTGASFGA